MAFHIHNHGSKKRQVVMSDINITPFVDVLLVLLIIFMIAAPMMMGSVELELPKGASDMQSQQEEPVSVSIKNDGSIYVGEDLVELSSISKVLLKITNQNVGGRIFVRADTNIDYGKVMEVVRTINKAGFTQVVLVTDLSFNVWHKLFSDKFGINV